MAAVLLIDPERARRDEISIRLRERGHSVTEAEDNECAARYLKSSHPDLVLTDLLTGGLSTHEVLRDLLIDRAAGTIPIVIYSGRSIPEEVRLMAAACGVRYLASGLGDMHDVLRRVDEALSDSALRRRRAEAARVDRRQVELLSSTLIDKVHQLRATRSALVESEARFRAMAESAPVGILAADSPGVWTYANRRFAEICGLPDDDRLSWSCNDLVHPEDRSALASARRAATAAGGRGRLRARVVRPAGGMAWVDVEWAPVGTTRRSIATVHDVTAVVEAAQQREALEARLRVSERLEGLGQLAGGIAHDFNNLLAVILNYADFVGEAVAGDDATAVPLAQVREDVAEISLAARRAAELTHQLLIFGRREVVRPEVIDAGAAVESLAGLLQRTIGEHVTLDIRVEDGLWPMRVDPVRFQQVLVNLVVNARDAIMDTGTVVVTVENLEFDEGVAGLHGLDAAGRYVRMVVADTGAGMAPDVAARAFEPFFTTKEAGEGTGLGLSTVYGIVRQWGGAVRIYSELGQGTVVRVCIPVAEEEAEAAGSPLPDPASRRGNGELVLVVEDEDAVLATTRRILEDGGYAVVAARSGAAGLDLLRVLDRAPAVLLSDVVMPNMSGLEFTKRAAELCPGANVVFMSGYPHHLVPRQGIVPAGVVLIEKPFTRQSVLTAVGTAAQGLAP